MDFSFSEEQDAVSELATKILDDQANADELKAFDASGEPFLAKTWKAFADAGLLGISLPESVGGGGLGFLESCLILEQIGLHTAPVPYHSTIVLGALPIAQFGTDEQQQRWLPGVVSGEITLSAGLYEPQAAPTDPQTTATADGDGWVLEGTKLSVPFGEQAAAVLVPARTGDGSVGVFIVDTSAAGVSQASVQSTSSLAESELTLSGVKVGADAVLGAADGGAEVLEWLIERATTAMCVTAAGVCETALRMTAEYIKTREQFDRPIATFQAAAQRIADAYIDTEAVRLTSWQAAWRIDSGLPARAQVDIAKFWTAEGGQRVVHAAQHLHGGMGVDKDYPLHRYFYWAKQLELTLGGGTAHLLDLGEILATEPV
jgi:alkylation response protein AidB-like acyl-CoA dehydrogenase